MSPCSISETFLKGKRSGTCSRWLCREFGGIGLVRVAQLPEYQATKQDALTVLRWAAANKSTIFEALKHVDEMPEISDVGRAGLTTLSGQLVGMGPGTSPWTLLTTWLFERSRYLAPTFGGPQCQVATAIDARHLSNAESMQRTCGQW